MIWAWMMMTTAQAGTWNETVDDVVGSVLVLRYDRTRAFNGDSQSSPQASGFIVDAERGIILTNRHVVGTSPQVARALFPNQESIAIRPLYTDPVHDYGFYQYDPSALKDNQPTSLRLVPEDAKVGTEIRLIGNDAGEQISILDGTLSRVDRSAPWWDMNTFFAQAASDSSGGSSGSPVIDIDGDVVALNSGGRTQQSTSYYLRLERVKVALEALQRGEIPDRGTLMVEWEYLTFDQLERLGLTGEHLKKARSEWSGTGMLVVKTVGIDGPTAGVLKPGDILLSIDDTSVYTFHDYEDKIDATVGTPLSVRILRGGTVKTIRVTPTDLHQLDPKSFLHIDEGEFQNVGGFMALKNNRGTQGVMVARPSDMFREADISSKAIIHQMNGESIANLDDFQRVLTQLAVGTNFSVKYTALGTPNKPKFTRARRAKLLFPAERCTSKRSVWSCETVEVSNETRKPEPAVVVASEVLHKPARAMAKRLVKVTGSSQFPMDSTFATEHVSTGIVVDAAKGLVWTDRWAVADHATRIQVQAGDAPSIPAQIVALDPLYNSALIRFDPAHLRFPELEPLVFADEMPEIDGDYWAVVLDADGRPYSTERKLDRFDELGLDEGNTPMHRADNLTTLEMGKFTKSAMGGPVVDKKGRIVGVYQKFRQKAKRSIGSKLKAIHPHAGRDLIAGKTSLYSGIDIARLVLPEAREAGLSEDRANRVRTQNAVDPHLLEVWRVDPSVETDVRVGDVLLDINGELVTSFLQLQEALKADNTFRVLRNGKEVEATSKAIDLEGREPTRIVRWAGAWIEEEPPVVARQSGTPKAGVYVTWHYGGSPAQRYGLRWGQRILSIDGKAIEDLEGFVDAVKGVKDQESVRVGLQSLKGRTKMITLRTDTQWWPTLDLTRNGSDWAL